MPGTTTQRFDPQPFLASVGNERTIVTYQRGQLIFRQGDAADAVFYIHTGKVQIIVVSEQGKEGVIAILESGEFFGEGCLAGQPLHMATAKVLRKRRPKGTENPRVGGSIPPLGTMNSVLFCRRTRITRRRNACP